MHIFPFFVLFFFLLSGDVQLLNKPELLLLLLLVFFKTFLLHQNGMQLSDFLRHLLCDHNIFFVELIKQKAK